MRERTLAAIKVSLQGFGGEMSNNDVHLRTELETTLLLFTQPCTRSEASASLVLIGWPREAGVGGLLVWFGPHVGDSWREQDVQRGSGETAGERFDGSGKQQKGAMFRSTPGGRAAEGSHGRDHERGRALLQASAARANTS